MKHAYSKSAPTGRLEYDDTHGFPLAPIEYKDHIGGSHTKETKSIVVTLDHNTQRLQRLTDSVIQLFARIH